MDRRSQWISGSDVSSLCHCFILKMGDETGWEVVQLSLMVRLQSFVSLCEQMVTCPILIPSSSETGKVRSTLELLTVADLMHVDGG